MKEPKYAKIPENTNSECLIDLTIGKEYRILEYKKSRFNDGFYIKNDNGTKIYCLEKACAHLCNQNWELS